MGYLFRISFLGYNLKSYPDYQKISYHILKYPKISAGANSQMMVLPMALGQCLDSRTLWSCRIVARSGGSLGMYSPRAPGSDPRPLLLGRSWPA